MADNIPFEIQVEIMKRLPVKSLVVSRSVSKSWKLMIDSPLFIADHTNLRRHYRLLIRYGIVHALLFEAKYVSIKDDDTLSQHTVSNHPESRQLLAARVLVGTSQGLLCLSGISVYGGCDNETAVIWNPSLGKSIAIDVPGRANVLGFGVRPDNFDPVIVLINRVGHYNPVMVFTISSRVWRVPRGNLPPESIRFNYGSPVATDDQRIYWEAYDRERTFNLVVAFDMVSEDFAEIHLPHSLAHRFYGDFSISRIRGSLALLEYCIDSKKPVCGVWLMAEDDVSKPFRKLFTINTPDAPLRKKVLGFSKNDQPIMETPTDKSGISTLEAYEPHTRAIKNLGINGVQNSFFCCSYTETLILLDQLDGSKQNEYKHKLTKVFGEDFRKSFW